MSDFKGVFIPANIFLIAGLSLQEKLLIITIKGLDNGNGCYAGNDYLSRFIQVNKSTCSSLISNLKNLGIIFEPKAFDGRKRYLSINEEILIRMPTINMEAAFVKDLSSISELRRLPTEKAKAETVKGEGRLPKKRRLPTEIPNHINIDINIDNNIITNIEDSKGDFKKSNYSSDVFEELQFEEEKTKEKPKENNPENAKYYFEFYQVISRLSELTGAKYRIPETMTKFLSYKPYTLLKALFEDGNDYEIINKIVEAKCAEWLSDSKMCAYLVPDTLFRKSNFEKYLAAIQIRTNNGSNNQPTDSFAEFLKKGIGFRM